MKKTLSLICSFILLSGCSYDTSEYENAYDDGYKEGLKAGKLESENYYEDIIFSKENDKYKEGYNEALNKFKIEYPFQMKNMKKLKILKVFAHKKALKR